MQSDVYTFNTSDELCAKTDVELMELVVKAVRHNFEKETRSDY